ncbi:MAG TPA: Gfo/Idh/MocA family oxidoreductase, partial [Chloroflexota bacterium]|nr:Gfo/Idh/MocA family oxidoreductase [Chloroflexota bacterium]
YGMTDLLLDAGGELAAFFAPEPELVAEFARRYPQAPRARSAEEILESSSIDLVASASISDERAGLGVSAMRHGKDYLADKPGFTTLDQLAQARAVQRETGRIYSVCYSERFQNRATVRAGELVQSGAIGRPIQTVGLGPHRLNAASRPAWFFERSRYGGILTDIGSHQADQFLFFTGSTSAEVVASQVANFAHPEYPELDDFGDMLLRGDGGRGYIRVDWFTPDGLGTWGDGRLTILGTDGYIELRKYIDLAGRPGGDHLFLVDKQETRYIDCHDQDLPFGRQLLNDVRNRTETAMPQAHAFLASELALRAQAMARSLQPEPVPA